MSIAPSMQDGRAANLRLSGVDAAMEALAMRAHLDLPFAPAPTLRIGPGDEAPAPPFDDIDAWSTTGAHAALRLLEGVIEPDEPLTVIGGDGDGVAELQRRYGLKDVRWHCTPARLKHNPGAILAAAEFAAAQDSRFVFICVGVQQEALARAVAHCSKGRGAGLCVGVPLYEICGRGEPAPAWMADLGLGWLHRLLREPRR